MPATVTESGWMNPLLVVIEKRLEERGVFGVLTGRIHLADPPENTKRPLGVFMPGAVRNQKFTNKTKYADLEFRIDVYSDTFKELDATLCPTITAALQHAPLVPENGTLNVTMIRPGDIEYDKVEQIWVAVMTFTAQCNQPARGTPAA